MGEAPASRAVILAGIRHALGEPSSREAIAAEYAAIPRGYDQSSELDAAGILERFVDRLVEYEAGVYFAARIGVAARIAEILRVRGKAGLATPAGLPARWLPEGFDFPDASGWDEHRLDACDGILCGCTVAIAETGTLVLQNVPGQGRRILSLVPDYHLCVVLASQIVATVPEAFARLAATSTLPTTFISGPSATADIEMTRIKGVHGPRFLDVVIVEDS
jgi:L-lactate dehydrogenase complex protein LldG